MTKTNKEEILVMKTKLDATMIKLDDLAAKIDKFIEAADTKYATKEQAQDQETRIRQNEKFIWIGIGGLALLQVVLAALLAYFF